MKKFAMFAALLSLTALTVGCDKPVEKKAAAPATQAAPVEGEAKPADADMDADKAAEPMPEKSADEADGDDNK